MGRVSPSKRSLQIKIKLKKKLKLARLRQKYLTAKTLTEKDQLLEKAHRLAPWLSKEKFLNPIKGKI